jgi:hypothetical protein
VGIGTFLDSYPYSITGNSRIIHTDSEGARLMNEEREILRKINVVLRELRQLERSLDEISDTIARNLGDLPRHIKKY